MNGDAATSPRSKLQKDDASPEISQVSKSDPFSGISAVSGDETVSGPASIRSGLYDLLSTAEFAEHKAALLLPLLTPDSTEESVLTLLLECLPVSMRCDPLEPGTRPCLAPSCHLDAPGATSTCSFHAKCLSSPGFAALSGAVTELLQHAGVVPLVARCLFGRPSPSQKLAVVLLWMLCVPHRKCRKGVLTCKPCSRGVDRFRSYVGACCVTGGGPSEFIHGGLLLILVGQPIRAVADPSSTGLVGGTVRYPVVWKALLFALAYGEERSRVQVLREMTCMIVGNAFNCDTLMTVDGWSQMVLRCLPEDVSDELDLNDAATSTMVVLAVNILSEIAVHSLMNRSDFSDVVDTTCAAISAAGKPYAWAGEVSRLFLSSLCAKIDSSKNAIALDSECSVVPELMALGETIRRFIFHQPEIGARDSDAAMFVFQRVLSTRNLSSGRFRETRKQGIHWTKAGHPADLPLARKTLALFAGLAESSPELDEPLDKVVSRKRADILRARNYFCEVNMFLENLPVRSRLRSAAQIRKSIQNFARKNLSR